MVYLGGGGNANNCEILWNSNQNVFQGTWNSQLSCYLCEFNGVFNVDTLKMIEGDLPARAQRLIEEWAQKYQKELKEMWQTQKFMKLHGIE